MYACVLRELLYMCVCVLVCVCAVVFFRCVLFCVLYVCMLCAAYIAFAVRGVRAFVKVMASGDGFW